MENTLPPKTISIVIRNNTYTLSLPNTGQFIEIQALKTRISAGEYDGLSNSDLNNEYAKVLVDMIATYNVMIPELKKDINVKAISELDLLQSKELLDPYIEIYLPWITNWMDIISRPKSIEDKKQNELI